MQGGDPAVLAIGTQVSAKYKGAYCEAKVKSIDKLVKARVTLKGREIHINLVSLFATEIWKYIEKVKILSSTSSFNYHSLKSWIILRQNILWYFDKIWPDPWPW